MQGSFAGQVLLVGIGGFIGSALRFSVYAGVQRWLPQFGLPLGTLTVNILGCLAIGYVAGFLGIRQSIDTATALFLMVGVLGGFTTFSAYALEALMLSQNGMLFKAALLVCLQVVFGLAAAWLGFQLVR
jgi:CrcB protein